MLLHPRDYQTFQIHAEPDTLIVAACRDVGCQAYLHGWQMFVDESNDLGRRQAAYLRHKSGRDFTEARDPATGMTVFRFAAFQRCFIDHETQPEFYTVRGGHANLVRPVPGRDTPSLPLIREHTRPADWVEHVGEHQQMLAEQAARG